MAREHPPETRAAVMAALLAGQAVTEVAKEYQLPSSTVSRWKAMAREEAGRSDDVGELLLQYLKKNLQALGAQAELFADPGYLRTWPAEQLAVLHGVMTDKAVRLLEALEGSGVQSGPSRNGHRNRVGRHG